jgi:basic membrane protein A
MKISDFCLPKKDNMANTSTKLTINIVKPKNTNKLGTRCSSEQNRTAHHHGGEEEMLSSRSIWLAAGLSAIATSAAYAAAPVVVYVSPNPLGVNEYLKGGAAGAQAVAAEMGGTAKVFESVDPITRKRDLDAAAREGAKYVVSIGFEFSDLLAPIAKSNPNTTFIAIDYCPKDRGDNIYCVTFREYEVSFLAGAEAGWMKPGGGFAAIGGVDIPLIHRYTDAFLAGVMHASPDAAVRPVQWVGGSNPFSDPARASQIAQSLYFDGVDTIIAAAGASGEGVVDAAKSMLGKTVVMPDINHCPSAPAAILDNVEKRADVAIEISVRAAEKKELKPDTVLGLKEGGVALTTTSEAIKPSQCLAATDKDVMAKVEQLRKDIVDGKVSVADPAAAK